MQFSIRVYFHCYNMIMQRKFKPMLKHWRFHFEPPNFQYTTKRMSFRRSHDCFNERVPTHENYHRRWIARILFCEPPRTAANKFRHQSASRMSAGTTIKTNFIFPPPAACYTRHHVYFLHLCKAQIMIGRGEIKIHLPDLEQIMKGR